MVFKRRDRRSPVQVVTEFLYPRGGWTRAFHYVKHRIRRLPDSPERIARGVGVGVFASFTPFYGLHFVVAALGARLINGNFLASLSGTFFGNPLTYVPIGVISLQSGHFLLGTKYREGDTNSLLRKFGDAGSDLWHNFLAVFSDRRAHWHGLEVFFDQIFYPYMIGCVLPGVIFGVVCYFLTVPLIRAYQQRRRAKIKAKFEAIRKMAEAEGDAGNETPLVSPRKPKKGKRNV